MAGSSSNASAVFPPFDLVDDLYFLALFEEDEVFPITDEKYSKESQLQEVLVPSKGSLPGRDVTGEVEEPRSAVNKGKGMLHEVGSSSFFCGICMDRKESGQVFTTGICPHVFCVDCIGTYVATWIRENKPRIECPGDKCSAILEPYTCRPIILAEALDRWENELCESLILGLQKFYCPFKDCSVLLVEDGGEILTVSECPICRRLFCTQSKVARHSGLDCDRFRRKKEGIEKDAELNMLAIKLEESKKWRKCPQCNFYVEKSQGCSHIRCRCGFHFCYHCGNKWNGNHNNCKS